MTWLRRHGLLVGFALALAAIFALALRSAPSAPPFPLAELARADAVGTPPRLEREFKFGLEPVDPAARAERPSDAALAALIQGVHDSLARAMASPEWRMPAVVGSHYYGPPAPMVIVVRDVYLDTAAEDLRRHAACYRLRYRFYELAHVHGHDARMDDQGSWPYRCEIQSKVDRRELGGALSECIESRFEYRVESAPFSRESPPPPPPWPVLDYLEVMRTGRHAGHAITPATSLARSLSTRGVPEGAPLVAHSVVITTRQRTHLEIQTPYGSGPNPTQAFIVSLDRSDVYEGGDYVRYLERVRRRKTPPPTPRGTFLEVEIEFERNVSTRIDEACAKGDDPLALRARDALHADQARIGRLVLAAFAAQGLRHTEKDASKYEQTCRILD